MPRVRHLPLLLPLAAACPAFADDPRAVRVTTDSTAYCAELATRFAGQHADADETARRLAKEGIRLCREGYPRTGIAKLRRALRNVQGAGG